MKTTVSSKGQIVLPASSVNRTASSPARSSTSSGSTAGDYRLVRRPAAASAGAVDWLLACPAKGYFVPVESESTDTL